MRSIRRKISKWTARVFDLPPDVVFDLPRVTMIGNRQLYIENHRGVIHFAENGMRLALSKGELEIRGKELVIRAILTEEVMVEGIIDAVNYKE
jgi:sporulation protein YqfC